MHYYAHVLLNDYSEDARRSLFSEVPGRDLKAALLQRLVQGSLSGEAAAAHMQRDGCIN